MRVDVHLQKLHKQLQNSPGLKLRALCKGCRTICKSPRGLCKSPQKLESEVVLDLEHALLKSQREIQPQLKQSCHQVTHCKSLTVSAITNNSAA